VPVEDPAFEPPLPGVAYPGTNGAAHPPTRADLAHEPTRVMPNPTGTASPPTGDTASWPAGDPASRPTGGPGSSPPAGRPNRGKVLLASIGMITLIMVVAGAGWALTRNSTPTAATDVLAPSSTLVPATESSSTGTGRGEPAFSTDELRLEVEGPRQAITDEAVTFTAVFEAAGQIDAEIDWTFGDELRSGPVVTYAWSMPGTKRVRATMIATTETGQVTSSQEFTVQVDQSTSLDPSTPADPSGPTVADAVADGGPTNGILADFRWEPAAPAAGQSIQLIEEANISPAGTTWRWLKSTISTGGNLSISLNQPTEVTLEVCRDQARSECDSVTKLITVG